MQAPRAPCDALFSHGAAASSRVLFPGAFSKPSRLRCVVRSPGAGAGDMTFYELLGIPESGTLQEIKQAYKQLARKYHPDVSPAGRVEDHTRRFIRVQEAYETLSDPARRAVYDTDLAGGFHLARKEMEYKREWRSQWQSQLSELKRRSKCKDAGRNSNSSRGAQMCRQKDESSAEEQITVPLDPSM